MLGVTGAVYVTSLPGVVWRRNQAWFGVLFVVMHSPVLLFIVDSTALAHPSVLEGVKLSLFGSLCGIVGAVIYGGCVLLLLRCSQPLPLTSFHDGSWLCNCVQAYP